MTLPRTAADVLASHVTLQVESIDRMYLNLYVPQLQRELGVVGFFKHHRGKPFASGALMQPITEAFVAAMHRFADEAGIDWVSFKPGQRKDDVALEYLAQFDRDEGVLFIGVALVYATEIPTRFGVFRGHRLVGLIQVLTGVWLMYLTYGTVFNIALGRHWWV